MADPAAKRAILIAGPTASGKSALALTLAERHGGVVVNADSMQVYADLAILTARPSSSEAARVPHRLFGHIDAADAYSVGRWTSDVREALRNIEGSGRMPVIVGGTGLYLTALTSGLSEIPDVPPELRAQLRSEASEMRPAELHARLAVVDPDAAERLRPSDPQRVLRALEVFAATGCSILAFHNRRAPPALPWSAIAGVCLDVPRAELNTRIDTRFDMMMEAGALDEVEAMARRRLDPALPAMRSLGAPQLLRVLDRSVDLPSAIAAAKTASRHYAKRQVTYARHQLRDLRWVRPEDATEAIESQLDLPRP